MILNETVVCFLTVIFESVLFGVSLVLLAFNIKELFRQSSFHWRMLVLVCMFFTLSTIGYIAILYRNITFTILVTRGTIENTADSYEVFAYSAMSTAGKAISFLAYMGSGLLADAVVIHRSSRVWRKKWVLILPCVSWLGFLASTVGSLIARLRANDFTPERHQIARSWETSSICLSLVTNLLSTGLLAYKVYSVHVEASSYRLGSSSPTLAMTILRVVVESGIIYSVWLIVSIIVTVIDAGTTRIFLSTLNSIIPITFYLIIIRLAQARGMDFGGAGSEASMVFRTTTNSDFTDFTISTTPNRSRNGTGTQVTLGRKSSIGKSVGSINTGDWCTLSPPLSPRSLPRKGSVVRVTEHGHELGIRTRRSLSDASSVTLGSSTSPQGFPHLRKGSQDSCVVVTQSVPIGLLKEVPEAVIKA